MQVLAYKGDVSPLAHMARTWLAETHGNAFGIDINVEAHMRDLQGLVDGDDSDLLVLVDGGPVGYIGMTWFNSPLGGQKVANEHYWYVLPDYRGLGSVRMIQAAKAWAISKDCTHLIMTASNMASDMHDRVCRLYEQMQMKKFETSFITEV